MSEELKIVINGDASKARAELSSVQKSVKTLAKVSKVAFSAAGVAAAAFTTFAINKTLAFNAAISDLSAITGATGKDLKYLETQAKSFGSTTTLSATQAAEAFKLIASAKPDLLDNAQALSQVTGEVIKLAEASGVDLAFAADAVGASLNQFGADADEAARFVNVLAAGAKFGSSSVNDTATALKNAGTVASAAGLSFEETNAAIQALAKVAIKGGEAGTGLRGVLLKLSSQTKSQFNPEIVGFTKAMKNLKDANLTTTEKTKLFGLESITSANALMNEADSLDTLTAKLTGTDTALEQATTRMDNLAGDLKGLESATEGAGIALGQALDPWLRSVAQASREAMQGVELFINVLANADEQSALAVQAEDLHTRLNDLRENGLLMSGEWLDFSSSEAATASLTREIEKLERRRRELLDVGGENDNLATGGDISKSDVPKPVKRALDEAEKVINIHASKYARLNQMAAMADASSDQRAMLKLNNDLSLMSDERSRLKAQGKWSDDLEESYSQARISRAQITAIELERIESTRIAQVTHDRQTEANTAQAIEASRAAAGMQALTDLASLQSSHSRKAFDVGKAAAISETVINTHASATKSYNALANIPYVGPYLGAAAAAAAIASGINQVQKIKSTQFGSGSVTGGAALSPPTAPSGRAAEPAVPTSPTGVAGGGQTINVTVTALDPSSVSNADLQRIAEALAPHTAAASNSGFDQVVNA